MSRRRRVESALGTAVAVVLSGACGCKRTPDPEAEVRASFVAQQALAADAGSAWQLTSNDEVFFDDGWFPLETFRKEGVHGEAWRWMGRESLMRLRAHSTPMKLEIAGWVPIHLLGAPPLVTLRWKGNRVDAFLAPAGRFSKTIAVTEAMQAGSKYADFTIETSSTGREKDETRDLGFAISELHWVPADSKP